MSSPPSTRLWLSFAPRVHARASSTANVNLPARCIFPVPVTSAAVLTVDALAASIHAKFFRTTTADHEDVKIPPALTLSLRCGVDGTDFALLGDMFVGEVLRDGDVVSVDFTEVNASAAKRVHVREVVDVQADDAPKRQRVDRDVQVDMATTVAQTVEADGLVADEVELQANMGTASSDVSSEDSSSSSGSESSSSDESSADDSSSSEDASSSSASSSEDEDEPPEEIPSKVVVAKKTRKQINAIAVAPPAAAVVVVAAPDPTPEVDGNADVDTRKGRRRRNKKRAPRRGHIRTTNGQPAIDTHHDVLKNILFTDVVAAPLGTHFDGEPYTVSDLALREQDAKATRKSSDGQTLDVEYAWQDVLAYNERIWAKGSELIVGYSPEVEEVEATVGENSMPVPMSLAPSFKRKRVVTRTPATKHVRFDGGDVEADEEEEEEEIVPVVARIPTQQATPAASPSPKHSPALQPPSPSLIPSPDSLLRYTQLPERGDTIAYKMLEIDPITITPQVSAWRTATITTYDPIMNRVVLSNVRVAASGGAPVSVDDMQQSGRKHNRSRNALFAALEEERQGVEFVEAGVPIAWKELLDVRQVNDTQ